MFFSVSKKSMAISGIIQSLLLLFSFIVLEKSNGFRTKLYHRDFPGSPLFDPTLSQTERVRRAVDRSIAYHTRSASVTPNSAKGTVKFNYLDYMMKIGLGTPPVEYFVALDTGADMTWLECMPCQKCLVRDASSFDPGKSPTYRKIGCNADQHATCPDILGSNACTNDVCTYTYTDVFGTKTSGDLSTDVLTLESSTDQPVVQANFTFGCGNNNEGFISPQASGVIGLGGHVPASFMSQLHEHTQGKFMYCLVAVLSGQEGESTINFGQDAILNKTGVVTTPLHQKSNDNGYGYYAQLEAITIAGERIEFAVPGSGRNSTEIRINSGASVSRFPTGVFGKYLQTFVRHVNAEAVADPRRLFSLCYYNDDYGLDIPDVTAHFAGGADIFLDRDNLFVRSNDGVMCLAVAEDASGSRVEWGGIAQTNFFVGFDIEAGTLSFLPTVDCSND